MKKNNKERGLPQTTKASCGQAGCAYKEYTMPFAGTKEAFKKHFVEKFKTFTIKQVA